MLLKNANSDALNKNIFKYNLQFGFADQKNTYSLAFNNYSRSLKVFDASKEVGNFRYIIRNDKLEEIEGVFLNEKFYLDPVYLVSNKLRQENLIISDYKAIFPQQKSARSSKFSKSINNSITLRMVYSKNIPYPNNIVKVNKLLLIDNSLLLTEFYFYRGFIHPLLGKIEKLTNNILS